MSRTITQEVNDSFLKVTEVELIYRNKIKATERPVIKKSEDAYKLLFDNWDHNKIELQEQFKIILLDRKHGCMGIATIGTGCVSACVVDPKIIFATALKGNAASLVLAHNHPSGNKVQSKEDENLTWQLCEVGKFLGMPIIDHLIITKDGYLSFADEGILYTPQMSFQKLVSSTPFSFGSLT